MMTGVSNIEFTPGARVAFHALSDQMRNKAFKHLGMLATGEFFGDHPHYLQVLNPNGKEELIVLKFSATMRMILRKEKKDQLTIVAIVSKEQEKYYLKPHKQHEAA